MRMVVQRDLPQLDLKAGDLITWQPDTSQHPFIVTRRASYDYGALLVALNDGGLEPIEVMPGASPSSAREQADREAAERLRPLLRLHRRLG